MNASMRAFAAALVLALPFTLPANAVAGAPLAKKQAPGWYRYRVGQFEVTAILDGTAKLKVTELLKEMPKEQIVGELQRHFLGEEVETSVNAFLVNTGSKLVLVDTGTGGTMGYKSQLMQNLRASGYRPEQVDEVYITHMHGDHVGGLAVGKAAAFPNATLRIDKRDADFWTSEAVMNRAPAEFRDFFRGAMAAVAPYKAAGRFKTFEGPTELVPGVHAMPAYGHTPGHTIYRVESGGQTLVLWGDLMHVAAVQFDHPEVTIEFDNDSDQAKAERAKAFAEASAKGWAAGVAHISFPGIGHIRAKADGKGYTWIPANYSSLLAQ